MSKPVSVSTQLLLVAAFLALNTGFNLYNKWVFTPVEKDGAGLSVPLFATMCHSLGGFFTAFVLHFFPSVYVPKEISGLSKWIQIIFMSVFFASTIGLNNTSLMHLPLSIQQTIRACSPVVLALAAFLIEGKRFSLAQIGCLVILVLGIILTVISNDSAGTMGILLASGSVLAGALYYTYVSLHLGPSGNLNVLDVLLYTSIPVVIVLVPLFVVTKEYEVLAKFSSTNGVGRTVLLLLIGCVFAVSYNVLTFTFIAMLSTVYLSVVANFKLVLLIVFGIVVFGEEVGVMNAIGLGIATVGFCGYSYLEYKAREQADIEKLEKAAAEAKLEDQKTI